eukprot:SAG11_NODE_7012_length_1208_cov_56.130748_3_plen_60_part_00
MRTVAGKGLPHPQGNLESAAGILGFVVTPVLAGLSDAIGRRPLMLCSPLVSLLTRCGPT